MKLSTCCGSEPLNEIINGLAFCARCKEHAGFEEEFPECECGTSVETEGELCESCVMIINKF